MKTLTIIGTSGQGKVCLDIALKIGAWDNIQFLDDNSTSLDYPIVGKVSDYANFTDTSDFIVAIGNNKIRASIQTKLERNGCNIVSLIYPPPSVILGNSVSIGVGTVIMAGVIINPSVTIGNGCIINTGASIDHDCIIGDFTHLSPRATLAGTVHIGEKSWVGVSATIINNISICPNCIIGAGAVVVKSIDVAGTYVGVPARLL